MFLPMMKKDDSWRNPGTKKPKPAPLLPAVTAPAASVSYICCTCGGTSGIWKDDCGSSPTPEFDFDLDMRLRSRRTGGGGRRTRRGKFSTERRILEWYDVDLHFTFCIWVLVLILADNIRHLSSSSFRISSSDLYHLLQLRRPRYLHLHINRR